MRSRTLLYVVSGIVALAIVAGALVYALVLRPPPGAPVSTAVAVAPAPPPVVATPVRPAPQPKVAPAPSATPSFDVVRIEPSGDTVVAGRAAPGAAIELTDDGRAIGDAKADTAGEFVILPPALSAGRHPLRLSAKLGAAAPLVSEVYVAEVTGSVVAAKPSAPATLAATTPTPVATPTIAAAPAKPVAAASAPPAAVASAAATPAAATPAAATSAAPAPAVAASGPIVVASVRPVDPAGLDAEGRAPPGARIRLRLNDTLLAEAVADPDGKWRLTIQRGLTPGDYVLEAEIVDPGGTTTARANAPFVYPQREAVAATAPMTPQADASPAAAPTVATPSPAASAPAAMAPAAMAPTPAASVAAPPAPTSVATASPSPDAAVSPSPVAAASPSPVAVASPRSVAVASPSPVAAAPPAPNAAAPTPAPTAVETPVATAAHAVVAEVETVTVVKGDNLWDLARHFYGDGLRYADIFTANATQIHDPNLIYIGQIFVVPQKAPAK